jgi:large subunit ribosomal protein L24
MNRVKTGDQVIVIAGKDRGKTGKVIKILIKNNQAIVEGVNQSTKHQKPNHSNSGGKHKFDAPIDLSNLMLLDPKLNIPTKICYIVVDGAKKRKCKKSGEILD